jgi:phosphoribosylanthranilate isomerase
LNAQPVTRVKICGLKDAATYQAARDAGADFVGFVFFPKSPRAVTPAQAGAIGAPGGPQRVGLFVDADDALIEAAVAGARLDVLQLQGHESADRAHQVRRKFGLPVIKALPVGAPADLDAAAAYADAVDYLMFDAKPPPGATRPGGNARSFDWRMLARRAFALPWFLAGGLTPDTVADAIRIAAPFAVDVSSGVELAPGVKDMAKIRAFVAAARGA